MIKAGILLIAFIGIARLSVAQQIYMERTFGGAHFETDTLMLGLNQVLELMRNSPFAHDEFKKAKTNNSVAGLLGFSGGLMIAVPLVTAAIGGKPEWVLAAAGGTLILVSIPFTKAFYRHAENALEDYNRKYISRRTKTNLYFTGTGVKLVFRF